MCHCCMFVRFLTMAGQKLACTGLGKAITAPDWLNQRLFNSAPLSANISSFANLLKKHELIHVTNIQ